MKVELSISDDAELRAYIKEIIRGQIISAARDEVRSVVLEAIKSATKEKGVDHTIRELAKDAVSKAFSHSRIDPEKLAREYVRERIDGAVTELVEASNLAQIISDRLGNLRVNITSQSVIDHTRRLTVRP